MYLLKIVVLYLLDQIVKVKNLSQLEPNTWSSVDYVTILNNITDTETDFELPKLGSLVNAFIVMDFHRSKINEFLWQKFLLSNSFDDYKTKLNLSTKLNEFHKTASSIKEDYLGIYIGTGSFENQTWLQKNRRLSTNEENKMQLDERDHETMIDRVTRSSIGDSITLFDNSKRHSNNIRPTIYKIREVPRHNYREYFTQKWFDSYSHTYPRTSRPHIYYSKRKPFSPKPFPPLRPYLSVKRHDDDTHNMQWIPADLYFVTLPPDTDLHQIQFTTQSSNADQNILSFPDANETFIPNSNFMNTESASPISPNHPMNASSSHIISTSVPKTKITSSQLIEVMKPVIMETSEPASMSVIKTMILDPVGRVITPNSAAIKPHLHYPIPSDGVKFFHVEPADKFEWHPSMNHHDEDDENKIHSHIPTDVKNCNCFGDDNANDDNGEVQEDKNKGFLDRFRELSSCEMLITALSVIALAYFFSREFSETEQESPSIMILGGAGNPIAEAIRLTTTPRSSEAQINKLLQRILTSIEDFQQSIHYHNDK